MGLHFCAHSVAAAALCLVMTLPATAQVPNKDLSDVTLEQLMDIEITSASKKTQRVGDTASSVFVITHDMIQRSGLTSVPEVLRLAPGVQVARVDASKWAISIRGFAAPLANKLLVLVDGRSVYNDTFAGVYWAAQDMPLEEIERIELVRGPVAAIWGANAVNGVINIITRSPNQKNESSVVAGAGGDMAGYGSARYSGALGTHGSFSSYAGYRVHSAFAGPAGNNEGDWIHRTGGFKMALDVSKTDTLTVEGQGYTGNQNDVINYLSVFRYNPGPLQREPLFYSGGSLAVEWKRSLSEESSVDVHGYYDHYSEKETDVDKSLGVVDLHMQHHFFASPRNEVVWGVGYRSSRHNSVPGLPISFNNLTTNLFNGFVQDEFAWIPEKLRLIAGTEVQHNSFTGVEVQPSLRLLWEPSKKYATWAAVSRAVRTPSVVERESTYTFVDYDLGRVFPLVANGNSHLQSETLLGYELGQRVNWSRKLSLDVSAFYNFYKNLSIESPVNMYIDPRGFVVLPATYFNLGSVRTYGGEASLSVAATRRWNVSAGYSWLRILPRDYSQRLMSSEITGPTDPQHEAQLHSNLDVTKTLQFDTSLYYTGSIPSFGIPRHWRADVRLGWRPIPKIELSLAGQDLLGPRHAEFIGDVYGRMMQVERGITGYAKWSF